MKILIAVKKSLFHQYAVTRGNGQLTTSRLGRRDKCDQPLGAWKAALNKHQKTNSTYSAECIKHKDSEERAGWKIHSPAQCKKTQKTEQIEEIEVIFRSTEDTYWYQSTWELFSSQTLLFEVMLHKSLYMVMSNWLVNSSTQWFVLKIHLQRMLQNVKLNTN